MYMENKILGLDGKMYDTPQESVNILEQTTDANIGTIMDGTNTQQGTSTGDFNKSMAEAMPKIDEQTMQRLLAYQNRKPSIRENKKIGRNDPCPCGSGKKFKNCCMNTKDWNKLVKKQ